MPLTDGSLITRVQLADLCKEDLDKAGKKMPKQGMRKVPVMKFGNVLSASPDTRPADSKAGVAALVWGLFHARTVAHVLHLQTRSYATHMALDGLYNSLPGLTDSYIECFQGKFGLVTEYPTTTVDMFPTQDPVAFIEGLSKWFIGARSGTPYFSELENLLDEIQALIDSTAYKLKNLS